MKARIIAVIVGVVLTLSLLSSSLAACSKPEPTTPPAAPSAPAKPAPAPSTATSAAPAPSPTPAAKPAEAKPIEMRFSTYAGPDSPQCRVVAEWYIPELQKRANGKVKIQLYDSESLGKAADHYQLVTTGVADAALVGTTYTPALFPASDLARLPFLYSDTIKFLPVVNDMIKKGWFKEYDKVKVLATSLLAPYPFFFAKKKPMIADDIKGLKIRVSGGIATEALKNMGAVPVAIASSSDLYLALQRGTVDGAVCPIYFTSTYKLAEVTKYYLENVTLGGSNVFWAMNKGVWDSLPGDVKSVIDGLSTEFGVQLAMTDRRQNEAALPLMKQTAMETYTLPAAEVAKLRKASVGVVNGYIATLNKAGIDGTKFMEDAKAVMQQYGMEWPY